MKKVLIILLLSTAICFSFCAEAQSNQSIATKTGFQPQKIEYIGLHSAKINGKIPFLTKTNLLFKLIGKPAKLTKPDLSEYCGSYYEKPFKQAKVNGLEAEIYGDTAVVRSINFKKSPSLILKTPLINFSQKTMLTELKRVFPKSVKSQTTINEADFGKILAVHIAINKKSEDFWLLLFQNGKLVRIDYYSPC